MESMGAEDFTRGTLIRPAAERDLEALLTVENECFTENAYSEELYRHFLAQPGCELYILESGAGAPLGSVVLAFGGNRHGAAWGRILSVAVRPAARRQGLARRLMAFAEDRARVHGARNLRLESRQGDPAATALYKATGFRPVGRLPDYYGPGKHGLAWRKRLPPAHS